MPPSLLQRANEILKQLEEKPVGDPSARTPVAEQVKKITTQKLQLSIFDAHSQTFDEIRMLLESMDINRLTPVEALLKLNEIKSLLK
jgi:DNA mismatch repair protein MutS